MEDIVNKIMANTTIFDYSNVLNCSILTIFGAENITYKYTK